MPLVLDGIINRAEISEVMMVHVKGGKWVRKLDGGGGGGK